VNSDSSLYLDEQRSDSFGADLLSIALIGPDKDRRKAVAGALAERRGGETREFFSYPASLDDVPKLLEPHFDIIIIDLDSQPEYALELIESFCANTPATVMVYSERTDAELLVRCMRAGAREFLTLPLAENIMPEALARAAARRSAIRPATAKKAVGRLLVFLGAKGGDGVTTLACNFAVSLAQESGQSTLLIDLDLPLGDAALNLGVVAEYSAINALQNASRLDSAFLSKLLVKHSSGVSVLAAPGKFPQFPASNEAIDKLIAVARQDFENVVVDMGSRLDLMGTSLFKDGATVYLVIQAGIAGLRNSNRLISQYFSTDVPKLEIVLNRFQSRSLGVAEEQITKALTRPANWKIPNDYAAVRRMQHTAIPLALEDSPISRLIRQMARTACGLPATPEKGSGFSLKKISRSISAKISSSEEAPAPMQPVLAPEQDSAAPTPVAAQPEVVAATPAKTVDAAPAAAVVAAGLQTPIAPAEAAESAGAAEATAETQQGETTPGQPAEPQTRTYKGATYVRGEDGQWHLQRTQNGEAVPETPVIAWSTPAPIAYGAALGVTQLNAMASVPGRFAYNPSAGDLLPVGEHTLSVTFTPTDTAGYTEAEATVQISVAKATPVITWPAPASIFCRTALSATELNATASVPGTFVYTPAAGEALPAGVHTLSVAFTPADAEGYAEAQSAVPLTVTQATPTITWPAPASIAYGMALSANQLNATASVPGVFVYTPAASEVLTAGAHTLSATFTPADAESYTGAQASVPLTVTQATPIITWPAPAAISAQTALSTDQLNATALVPGTFIYTPAAGEVLPEGTHTLSVTFTPTDAADYAVVKAMAQLTVTKAAPEVIWPAPEVISHDVSLSAAPLSVESQFTPVEPAPAEAEEPAVEAAPAPRKAKAKAPAKPRVKTAQEVSAEVPAEPSVEEPVAAPVMAPSAPPVEEPVQAPVMAPSAPPVEEPVQAPVMAPAAPPVEEPVQAPVMAAATPSVEEPVQAPVMAPATPPVEEPIQAPVMAPATPPVEEPVQAPGMAPATPPVEEPVQAPVMAPAEPPVKTPAKVPARTRAKAPVKPHGKAPAKAREKAPAKAHIERSVKLSAGPPVETPATPPIEAPGTALVKAQAPKAPFDVGPGLDLMGSAVFEDGTTIYLVMQPGSAGLPNSNRLVSQFFAAGGPKPDFVINRFEPPSTGAAEGQTSTAFPQPAYAPGSRQVGQMVRQASDLAATPEKKTGFSIKGLGRSIWAKISTTEKAPSFTRLGLAAEEEKADTASGPTLSDLTAGFSAKPVYAPPVSTSSAAEAQMPLSASPTADRADLADASRAREQSASTPKKHDEPATRIYKGSTYVRGADGQWHLKQAEASEVKEETPVIALATPAPVAPSTVLSTDEPGAKPEPAPAKPEPAPAKPEPAAPKPEPAPAKPEPAAPKLEPALAEPEPEAPKPEPAPAKPEPAEVKEPAPKEEPEPREIPVDAPAKPLVEAAQEPLPKAPAKRPVKAAQKPMSKAPAKRQLKTVHKPLTKTPAKRPAKAPQKPLAKTPAKRPVKAVQKPLAKTPAKRPVKAVQKPPAKTAAKRLSKAVQRPLAKAAAKRPVKAVQKPPAKAAAKRLSKAVQKAPEKAAAKRPNKAVQKPPAKAASKRLKKTAQKPLAKAAARKYAPAGRKPLPAPKRKPAKAVKPSQPAVQKPAPEPIGMQPSPEPAVNRPAAGPAKKE
jgi:pilus assembly protein CpaE